MDTVKLPLLTERDTVDNAITKMNRHGRRAVVVWREDGPPVVYTNKAVLEGWSAGKKRLRDLGQGSILADLIDFTGLEGFDRHTQVAQATKIEERMDSGGHRFAYANFPVAEREAIGMEMVTIAARYETLAAELISTIRICVCSANPKHNTNSPPVKDNAACNVCLGTWRCA